MYGFLYRRAPHDVVYKDGHWSSGQCCLQPPGFPSYNQILTNNPDSSCENCAAFGVRKPCCLQLNVISKVLRHLQSLHSSTS